MEDQDGGKNPKILKLINSGAFGCIYRPEYTCSGNIGSAKYITKIQKSERTIANELRISKKIRGINGYVRFFAPVLKFCNVRISKDRIKDLKKCEVFENDSETKIESSTYVSMKTRYIGNKDLRTYIFSNTNYSIFLRELWRTHAHLLKAIQRLVANKIIHYDLKYNNIMFDEEKKLPIIIDFGQSWSTDKLETPVQLSLAFFIFDQYDYWCIDILICSYIFQEVGFDKSKNELVTESEIDHIYDVFIHGKTPKYESENDGSKKKIVNDVFLYNILKNPQKMSNFKMAFDEYIRQFINKRTWGELYEVLIMNSNTWDCYSLSVIYLNMLDDLFLSNSSGYNRFAEQNKNSLSSYVELMENILYSSPNNRPSLQIVLKEIELILRK